MRHSSFASIGRFINEATVLGRPVSNYDKASEESARRNEHRDAS